MGKTEKKLKRSKSEVEEEAAFGKVERKEKKDKKEKKEKVQQAVEAEAVEVAPTKKQKTGAEDSGKKKSKKSKKDKKDKAGKKTKKEEKEEEEDVAEMGEEEEQEGGVEEAGEVDEAAATEEEEHLETKVPAAAAGATAAKGGSITVFVGNLSFAIDDDGIKDVFKDCGEVANIKWLSDRNTGRFKGCGFLEFTTAEAATAALAKDGEEVMGRNMKVTTAETKPTGGGQGGGGTPGGAPHDAGEPNLEVYVGNLSYNIDEQSLQEALKECGRITNIRWIEDRATSEFKGAGFVTFESLEGSAKAVAMHGTEIMGRPLKCSYAKGKPDRGGAGGGKGKKFELSVKPEGCTKVFVGNLSYDIDDDQIKSFFKDCGDVVGIRWLTDKNTGDFKGVGFIDFSSEDAVDKAIGKAGERLLGRPIRIDYAN